MSTKLHIGCGHRIISGWINIDRDFSLSPGYPNFGIDLDAYESERANTKAIQYDVTQNIPYQNGTVSLIFNEDFYEHLDQQQQICFLAECYRVLEDGGWCRISTPELLYSMRRWSNLKAGKAGIYNEWGKWEHRLLVTQSYMRETAELFGFKVFFNGRNKSACPGMPKDWRPQTDREEHGNVFADLQKPINAVTLPV